MAEYDRPVGPELATALADAFLAGDWDLPGLVGSGSQVLRRRVPWLPRLARELLEVYRDKPSDRPRELAAYLAARQIHEPDPAVPLTRSSGPTAMVVNPWRLPVLDTLDDVAALLGLDLPALLWMADTKGLERSAAAAGLRHYRISHRIAPSGAVRVLEAPKPRLRYLQRRLLALVLHRIPLHDAAHGFRPGRSVASFAAPHAGRPVLVKLDLEGFFAAVSAGRVYGLLRTAGYPEPVAYCLTGLATTSLWRGGWRTIPRPQDSTLLDAHWRLGRRLAVPHLPQGAPTSPTLANLAAYRLDVRLTALARSWGGSYTRYADDLALSGGPAWKRGTSRLLDAVAGVVRDEGFALNARKTAVLPSAGRQVLGGLVVNERPHVGRAQVDALRAVLHNCAVHGPAAQNRDGHRDFWVHLEGRVGWVAQHDPARGARLTAMLGAIDWTA